MHKEDDDSSDDGVVVPLSYPLVDVAIKEMGACIIDDACIDEVKKNQQRNSICYSRCLINQEPSVVVIDGGRFTNIVSASLVEELDLHVMKHPNPYRLQ
jgi:hypothetical protein